MRTAKSIKNDLVRTYTANQRTNKTANVVLTEGTKRITLDHQRYDLPTIKANVYTSTGAMTSEQSYGLSREAETAMMYSERLAILQEAYRYSLNYHRLVDNSSRVTSYVWGAGFYWDNFNMPYYSDCSGFVSAILREFGYDMPRTTYDMIEMGRRVSLSEALPADLVLFVRNGSAEHVGFYAGRNASGDPMMIDCGGGGSADTERHELSRSGLPFNQGKCVRYRKVSASSGTPVYVRIINTEGRSARVPTQNIFKTIIYHLAQAGYSKAAIAGIMGNMQRESGFDPKALNGIFDNRRIEYTNKLNAGRITESQFINNDRSSLPSGSDGGYGLVQWTKPVSLKQGLWNAVRSAGKVNGKWQYDNPVIQMDTLIRQLNSGSDYGSLKSGTTFARTRDTAYAAREFYYMFERGGERTDPDGSLEIRTTNALNQLNTVNRYLSSFRFQR